jgi:hypothetical protein
MYYRSAANFFRHGRAAALLPFLVSRAVKAKLRLKGLRKISAFASLSVQ